MGIQVVGHTSFLGHTGYNNHSRNFFTHLNKYIPTRVRNYTYVDDISYLKPEERDIIIEQTFNAKPFKVGKPFTPNPNDVLVNIVLNESHHYFFYDHYESPMIAYNVWESTRQLPDYFNRILQYDQFWCPTEWQRQCTINQGYPADRVKVVPEGINGHIFYPSNDLSVKQSLYKKYGIPNDAFTFMIFGRWDTRKGTTETVKAFFDNFKDVDNAYLVLSADNPFGSDGMESTEERLKHYNMEHERIKVLHFPPREEYINWMKHGDCFLSCARAEGWNLPLLEAISCGTVSICSDWGAQLEFADGISYKVNVPNELPPKDVFMLGDDHDFGVWGEPDFEHLGHVMKKVYNDFSECQKHASKMAKFPRELFSWDNAARKAETYIKELSKKVFVVKEENKNKVFDIKFESTDDCYPKIVFNALHKKQSDIKIIVRHLNGQIIYTDLFKEIKTNISYWVSISILETDLDGFIIQMVDASNNLLQAETKMYKVGKPKISFVTSFYNSEKFIDDLADSVLEQTLTDWEWIITDDWSDDKTKEKLDYLVSRDRRIKYINQKHKQEIYWNPHKYANGDIICTIDSDDALFPKTAEVIAHFYDKFPEVHCIHVNGNYHLEEFKGDETFKNSSFCRFDNFDSILQKHQIYLLNESGYERVGFMFGAIRSYRNPGPEFDFNDGDYQMGKHEDLAKLLRLEEVGVPLYLNRTLYKIRMRDEGSNSGSWQDYGGDTEFEKMRETADNRRTKSFKHLHNYDSIREELYAFLYSKLNDERDRKKVCCLGFSQDIKKQELIKEMYFDHDIVFEKIDREVDYVFAIVRTKNDIKVYEELTNNLINAQINFFFINDKWEPSFYDLEDSNNYFKLFSECKDFMVSKRAFLWTTYLYKYCSIIYNIKREPKKLNLGCGNDIKEGYINVDRYNNTGKVDLIADLGALPFEDNYLDEIYTAHVFEHIGLNDMYATLKEWRRVLRAGGDLILRLPNLEHEINIWMNASDDQKWHELSRIFGAQSHPGNSHLCGFNPSSLKEFLESFDFEIIDIKEQDERYGHEIKAHAKKRSGIVQKPANYICHFVSGPYLEIRGDETKNYFVANFLDPDNKSTVHQELMKINYWTRPHRRYFTNWDIEVYRNGQLDFTHKFNAEGKRVLIGFDSKSLGDTLAWIPYMEEFRKKHKCELWVSTFWNRLFEPQKQYSKLHFLNPGAVVHDLYASYTIGCYDDDDGMNKNKVSWKSVPLQQVCSDTLGLEYKEIIPTMNLQKTRSRKIKDKYVCLSEFSTFQSKFWNYPGGWQEIVDYLNELDYKVVVVSKEKTKLKNIIDRTNRSIHETINTIRYCDFFMGVSAGPSWLAWTLERPVVLISGYSTKWAEFKTKIKRVINEDVCHGCFNDPSIKLERGDWNWCPRQKGTHRQFECTKTISPEMVKKAIHEIIEGEWDG